jgi:hypothetical protein
MQTDQTIDSIARRYHKISLWIIVGLALASLFVMSVVKDVTLLNSLMITVVFSLVSCIAYGSAWKSVAHSSPASLTRFYLVAPAIRMMVAILVVVAYCLIVRQREAILYFVYIFLAFYVVLLIFDCIYFAQMEMRNKIYKK